VSKWSDECLFHASRPPQLADTIVGFTRWAVDRWYRPVVKVTDPDGDSVAVKFIWSDSLTSGWSPFVASGGTVTDSVKWQTTGRHVIHVLLKDKGSMVNPNAGAKFVNVSPVAVLWYTPDSLDFACEASPTLGELNGEPVLYIAPTALAVCLGLDGSIKWATDAGWNWSFASSLSNDGGRLYAADDRNGVFCFDARTGNTLWKAAIISYEGTPAVGPDGAIYVVTREHSSHVASVVRIRDCGDSAHVVWSIPFPFAGYPVWGVTAGASGVIYADCVRGFTAPAAIMALDTNGTVQWLDTTDIEGGEELCAPVTDSRGRAILADDGGNLYCFNQDGARAWKVHACDYYPYQGCIVVGYDDRIYLPCGDDRLHCYDSDGHELWAAGIPGGACSASSPCALADSTVLAYDGDECLLCCFSWDGDVLWTFSITDSIDEEVLRRGHRDEGDGAGTPLIGPDGNVYLTSEDYPVFCVAIGKARLANTAWPTYNHDNARSGWAGRQQR
jgi:outer membrane protein assembly factor BamB